MVKIIKIISTIAFIGYFAFLPEDLIAQKPQNNQAYITIEFTVLEEQISGKYGSDSYVVSGITNNNKIKILEQRGSSLAKKVDALIQKNETYIIEIPKSKFYIRGREQSIIQIFPSYIKGLKQGEDVVEFK